jgi:signal transduction histidine kinase
VRLTLGATHLEAVIEDDGAGFDPEALGHAELPRFGLSTMRERAEAIGGSLTIDSAPGRGTRVIVRIPVELASSSREIAGARADR